MSGHRPGSQAAKKAQKLGAGRLPAGRAACCGAADLFDSPRKAGKT